MLNAEEWNNRFQIQARWTEQVRRYLYQQSMLAAARRVLEVGCGTGTITSDIQGLCELEGPRVFGMDIRIDSLNFAHQQDSATKFTYANVCQLPYASCSMDITFCHFFLLWLKNPTAGILEMLRVTKSGGFVVALAEPDYGGRIDYPAPLAELGRMQAESLRIQGAEPEMGRRLSALFHEAGLGSVQTGLLGGQWSAPPSGRDWDSEWKMINDDLSGMIPEEHIKELMRMDGEAWQKGERVLFIPTFYALGVKQ